MVKMVKLKIMLNGNKKSLEYVNNFILSDKTNIVLAKMEYFKNWYCQVNVKKKVARNICLLHQQTQHDQMALLNSK